MAIFLIFNGYLLISAWRYLAESKFKPEDAWLVLALSSALIAYGVADFFGFALTSHYVYYYLICALLAFVLWGGNRQEFKFLEKLSRFFKFSVAGLLIFFISFIFYFFGIRSYVADCYFMVAKKAEAKYDCKTMLNTMNDVAAWQPADLHYKEQYLFLKNNCLPALTSKEDFKNVAEGMQEIINSYPAGEYNYYILMNMARTYSLLGYYLDHKYWPRSEMAYQELIKLNPEISVNYQDYGRMKMWAGDLPAAIKLWEKGIEVSPPYDCSNPKYFRCQESVKQVVYLEELIGNAYGKLNQFDKSIEYYLKVEQLQPNYVIIYSSLAEAYWAKGEPGMAIEYLEKGRRLTPTDPAWSYDIADFYFRLRKNNLALPYIQEAVKLDAKDKLTQDLLKKIKAKIFSLRP